MSTLTRPHGYVAIIIILALVALSIYVGIEVGMPFYRHSSMKNDTVELARMSLGQVDKLRKELVERAAENKVPVKPEHLVVERDLNNRVHVSMSWQEQLDILGVYQKTLDFTIDVTE